jgi:AraC family transcriptional regulator
VCDGQRTRLSAGSAHRRASPHSRLSQGFAVRFFRWACEPRARLKEWGRFTINDMLTARTCLFESTTGLVERVECSDSRRPGPEDFSPEFQIAFPYRGAFVWHVGLDWVVSDPNQVLFIKGGESFRIGNHPPDGFAEMIITPNQSRLRELVEAAGFDLERHPLFAARSRRATPALQRRCAAFVQQLAGDEGDGALRADESLVDLMRHALAMEPPRGMASPHTRRLIRRAKEYLDAHFTERVRLSDVADAAGASPAYLTDVFSRFEGISLHRYVMQLRLARSLVELPHAADLTTLALELAFSSHSHFTFAFRRAFGCTPSEYRRDSTRGVESREPTRISA